MSKKIKRWSRYAAKFKIFIRSHLAQKTFKNDKATSLGKDYFIEARSWADDLYTAAILSRNRYKIAFFVAMGLAILLAIALNTLLPLQRIEPLLVNHYQDGHVSVQPIHQDYAPINQAQVESEIVRYVMNRESFDATSYDTRYILINLLSDNEVAKEYIREQASTNKQSPINRLGQNGRRTVHIESVVFLDSTLKNQENSPSKKTHYNLAQVNFTLIDQFKDSLLKKKKALIALISWTYRDRSNNPGERWQNWNGFTVTRYTVEQRQIADEKMIP